MLARIKNKLGIEPAKREWPECVGMNIEQATKVIHNDWPWARIYFYEFETRADMRGVFYHMDLQKNRIRVTVVAGKVIHAPRLEWF